MRRPGRRFLPHLRPFFMRSLIPPAWGTDLLPPARLMSPCRIARQPELRIVWIEGWLISCAEDSR